MGPIRGVSNISENSTCLATEKLDQETRGEGEIEIGGALSIRALRIAMRTAAPSMVSAVQHGVGSENAGNANCAANYIDHPISFTAVVAPT